MIAPTDIPVGSRHRSPASPRPAPLLLLPQEILEQVLLALALPDSLRFMRTCSLLRDVYKASAQLQYQAVLHTSAHLDCLAQSSTPQDHHDEEPLSPTSSAPGTPVTRRSNKPLAWRSPHTGKMRSTVSSVTLPPWPNEPPQSQPFSYATSAAEKASKLRDREKRWETVDFGEQRLLKVRGREGVYELQEGIFLLCNDVSDEEEDKPSSIRLIPLPSTDDPNLEDPPIQTKANELPMSISDLTMDPSQDLIVISEYNPASQDAMHPTPTHRYHLLSMSTFKPHPLATFPTLDFPPRTDTLPRTRQLLQVMGDTLAVLVAKYIPFWILNAFNIGNIWQRTHEEELVFWNWKTGRVLSRFPFTEKRWFSSFALLSPTTFMVTNTSLTIPYAGPPTPGISARDRRPTIQVYSIATDPLHMVIPSQPLQNEVMDDTTPRPVLLAVLEMPKLDSDAQVAGFDVRPDPPFPARPKDKAGQEPAPTLTRHKPFTQDPSKGIMVLDFVLTERVVLGENAVDHRIETWPFELFLPRETLVKLGEEGEERLRDAWSAGGRDGLGVRGAQRDLEWEEWGEKGARLVDKIMPKRSWVCSCSGYRYISILPHDKSPFFEYDLDDEAPDDDPPQRDPNIPYDPQPSHIMLLDFSPYNVQKELSQTVPYPDSDDVEPPRRRQWAGETFVPPYKQGEGWKSRVVTEPTVLRKKNVWEGDVVSGLPYREVWREYGGLANGVMIDDQRVIVIKTKAQRNGDWSTIGQEMTVLCL
ncbi:hypothetical protein B9479_002305 [Cryptococcus floricola]|uniref:F-box domain-containing protein n=1 Tax=Cryptococcus floricola TaxID=2591691 RepID=A0A5D3B452_9TREE|nr:hypothetical protein B9479_002305 [Cryptococcus floricola]